MMICSAFALVLAAAPVDSLTMRWTFGAHEPYTMYRRMGKKSTGGIEGSAQWLGEWLEWWDAKAPETMREMGLNGLHSRFYKGMGWEEEKKDFPNVQRFVRNCHANGITTLAYVQFSTLYWETMKLEIPGLGSWAQIDEHGEKRVWNGYYFRWMPCVTCEEWQAYIERICEIALTDGDFDGIMFDNVFVQACYCERCERKFADHLQSLPDSSRRFGFSDVRGIRQPRPKERTDTRDPVYREWLRWRVGNVNAAMARFRRKIKSVKPDAIVSANAQPFRASANAEKFSLEMISFGENLDLFMMQSDSFPAYERKSDIVVNRVRDLKIAAELGKPIVALCDANAGQYDIDESQYMRPLVEDLIWRGIPTDRTVMSPKRVPGFIDRKRLEARKPQMAELNRLAAEYRDVLSAPSYRPVRILYPSDALMLSKTAQEGVTAAEEALLRNHMPYGYLIVRGASAPEIPSDCEVLLVANQEWLSDAQIAAIAAFARAGGRVVVTGESGLWDEDGAQRFANPLREALEGSERVLWCDKLETLGGEMGWKYRVNPPKENGQSLIGALKKTGWSPRALVEGAPPYVFADVRIVHDGFTVLMLNYNAGEFVSDVRIVADGKIVKVQPFDLYAVVKVE